MRSRTVLLGLLAWVAVVAAGAGVTWVVIDAAGQQVLGDGPVAVAPTPTAAPLRSSSPSPSPPRSPAPSRVPSSSSPSSAPASPSPSSSPPGRTGPATPAPDASVVRSWRGDTGTVVARCRANAISLDAATPSDGYRAEVGSRGPGDVEVTFAGAGRQVKIRGVCASGTPRFSVEAEGADD